MVEENSIKMDTLSMIAALDWESSPLYPAIHVQ
jgi:hypothetical protein